mgnify:CR=1 FL=1
MVTDERSPPYAVIQSNHSTLLRESPEGDPFRGGVTKEQNIDYFPVLVKVRFQRLRKQIVIDQ